MKLTFSIAAVALVAAIATPALAQRPPMPTPEEQAAAFDKADADKNGSLNAAEFKASLGERAAQMQDEMLKSAFDRRDADKDGKITKAEYTAPRAPRPQ